MVDIGTQTLPNNTIHSESLSPSQRDMIDYDPAIVSIGRSDEEYRDSSNGVDCQYQIIKENKQKINVVDQMIAQPRIPYVLLPKHFQPKSISLMDDQENHFEDNKHGCKQMFQQHFLFTNFFHRSNQNYHYNRSCLPFNIAPNNAWQDSYPQSKFQ